MYTAKKSVFFSKSVKESVKCGSCLTARLLEYAKIRTVLQSMCNVDYVGCTVRHLHQRFAGHNYSAIGEHFLEALFNSDIRVNFMFLRSSMDYLIASFMKCYEKSQLCNFLIAKCFIKSLLFNNNSNRNNNNWASTIRPGPPRSRV